jgi:hypothetical protein
MATTREQRAAILAASVDGTRKEEQRRKAERMLRELEKKPQPEKLFYSYDEKCAELSKWGQA